MLHNHGIQFPRLYSLIPSCTITFLDSQPTYLSTPIPIDFWLYCTGTRDAFVVEAIAMD